MTPLYEEKILEILTEIQSDIRRIKFDLQFLLKRRSQAAPVNVADGGEVSEFGEGDRSTSVEDVLRYLREKRGDDDVGSD